MARIMPGQNWEGFFRFVQRSRGDVMIDLPNGGSCSLKSDPTALGLLRMLASSGVSLEIRLTDPADLSMLARCMMDANYSTVCRA